MAQKVESKSKVTGLVLDKFYEKTYDELENDYKELVSDYENAMYGVSLLDKEIDFLATEVLVNAKWKGVEVYGIKSLRDIIVSLEHNTITLCKREDVRALFHYLNQFESYGTAFMDIQMDVLEKVSLVVKEINESETNLRDASFELHAKKQGIDPEQLRREQALEQEQAAMQNQGAPSI